MYQNQLALGKLIYGPKSSTPNAGLKTPQECYYTMQFEIKEQQPLNGGKKNLKQNFHLIVTHLELILNT